MINRVDVARKLHGSSDRLFGNSFCGGSVKAMDIIRESINVAYDYDELFDRLADLIDPTCKPMITVESLTESLTKYTSECSECGAIFLEIFQHVSKLKQHTQRIARAAVRE